MVDTEENAALIRRLKERGALNTDRVINAFNEVLRDEFVPKQYREKAYADNPLPIGADQTISAPHMVAHMTELIDPQPDDTVLEIGTGSGYQAAILSKLVDRVYTVEVRDALYRQAEQQLADYDNVTIINADGSDGYTEKAPYDKIVYTAAAPEIPENVFDQLNLGGILIAPVQLLDRDDGASSGRETGDALSGRDQQQLKTFYKQDDGTVEQETHYGVRFVPLFDEER